MINVLIRVLRNADESDLHADDVDVGSLYRVELDQTVTQDFADVALDVFHSNVAIEQLDDFSFELSDEDGKALSTSESYDGYSQPDSGTIELINQ